MRFIELNDGTPFLLNTAAIRSVRAREDGLTGTHIICLDGECIVTAMPYAEVGAMLRDDGRPHAAAQPPHGELRALRGADFGPVSL